ncbi:PLD nuclease N-terminal domain-containing protein [Caryophanon latum]|uniref:Transcriptional regulator n=1 Tax=Caryophanon latum TaxID=33977 RepID=A0A1C0YVP8_9BACL|nr:PLD nuclease N-terminal domain-containing protein [Caryophanon latum]OCS91231.1 transcriptional regulator [Caryophanon latum]
METITTDMLLMLAPLFVVQLILLVVALLDLRRVADTRGPKWLWLIIILFVNIVGPIVYFIVGRKQ